MSKQNSRNNATKNTLQLHIANDPFLKGINVDAFMTYMEEINTGRENNNDICELLSNDINVTIKRENKKNKTVCSYPNNTIDIGCTIRYEN